MFCLLGHTVRHTRSNVGCQKDFSEKKKDELLNFLQFKKFKVFTSYL